MSDKTSNFSVALLQLKLGKRISRVGWNGVDQWVELQTPDEHSKMTLPYFYLRTVRSELVPWVPSQTDLLAEDWICVE